MANTNSNLATAQAAATRDRSAGIVQSRDICGVMLFARGQVTVPALVAVNDTLTLIPAEALPVGAVFEPALSWVYCETDPGTALTLDIGPVSNPDALADALALTAIGTTSGVVTFDKSGTMPLGISDPIAIEASESVIATVKVSTAVDATVMQFCIAYRATA
jgi:hypothetical protein